MFKKLNLPRAPWLAISETKLELITPESWLINRFGHQVLCKASTIKIIINNDFKYTNKVVLFLTRKKDKAINTIKNQMMDWLCKIATAYNKPLVTEYTTFFSSTDFMKKIIVIGSTIPMEKSTKPHPAIV